MLSESMSYMVKITLKYLSPLNAIAIFIHDI